MKSSTLIVWLLVSACIAIDLAMIGELQIRRNEMAQAGLLVWLGLVFSQVTLVALWAVWGRSHILVRSVSTLLGVWAVSWFASYCETGAEGWVGRWFGVLLVYCGASLVLFIVARLASYELSNQAAGTPHPVKRIVSANQFTIGGILSLMTAVGITLAVIRFADFRMLQLVVIAFYTFIAATACTVLLLALFLSRMRYAIILTIVISPIAGTFLSLTAGGSTLKLSLMMCVQGVASLSAALVLRVLDSGWFVLTG